MNKKRFSVLIAILLMVLTTVGFSTTAQAATSMKLSCTSCTVYVGYTKQITVKINGKSVKASKCTFSTGNKKVATVSTGGYIKGIKAGTATITIKLKSNSKVKKTCKVTVKKNTIKVDSTYLNFAKGGTKKMGVKVNGNNAGGGTLNYSSSKKSIATVDTDGNIKAVGTGTVYITAKMKKDSSTKVTTKIYVSNTKTFTISTGTSPLNGQFLNYSTYNSYTKNYYVIRSYMEWFEKIGGGTLYFNSGTYSIPKVISIPSNVTIYLKDGAVLKKTKRTASKEYNGTGTMFQFVEPSKASKAHYKYNGVHDTKVIGMGNATIDMSVSEKSFATNSFVFGHNKNIEIKSITFKNYKAGHYMEMDASQNIKITNCTFTSAVTNNSETNGFISGTECINLDTPDKKTGGFTHDWTSYDCTPNDNIYITGCTFQNVPYGVGTHQYSDNKYHTKVNIANCKFVNCYSGGIQMMNWQNAVIKDNVFDGIGRLKISSNTMYYNPNLDNVRAIVVVGNTNPTISNNVFKNVQMCMYFTPRAKIYAPTYNHISEEEYQQIAKSNYLDTATILPTSSGKIINYMRVYNDLDQSGNVVWDTKKDYIMATTDDMQA